jgi:hypothetical protein
MHRGDRLFRQGVCTGGASGTNAFWSNIVVAPTLGKSLEDMAAVVVQYQRSCEAIIGKEEMKGKLKDMRT